MSHPTLEDYITTLKALFNRFYESESESELNPIHPKGGHPFIYQQLSMLIFFIIMNTKRIFQFKSQHRWLINHQQEAKIIGFETLPSRSTLSRRYKQLEKALQDFIKFIAHWAKELDELFGSDILFEDKSLFKAKGNVWHIQDQKENIIPKNLRNVDKEASWSKSYYHGWVYGYGLHTTVNEAGFPHLASAHTAKISESSVLDQKLSQSQLESFNPQTLVTDDGYTSFRRIKRFAKRGIALLTPALRAKVSPSSQNYHHFIAQEENQAWLKKRKTAIEPIFDLVSHLLDTKENHKQLPIKGLANVRSFLLLGVLMLQLAMIINSIWGLPLRNVSQMLAVFS
jgi:hypothetical protein